MSILKIKDSQDNWVGVQSIKGDKGDPFTYADFTPEQLESLKGKDGISPTVSVASDTSDDYRLSFTDETHTVTTPNLIPEAEKILSVYPHDTASGSIASFTDGADDIPLKSCIVQIEPVQAGSGDPSPDNVRPISGWTGVEVQRTGKNLLDSDNSAWAVGNSYRYSILMDNNKTVMQMTLSDKDTSVDVTGCYIGFVEADYDFMFGGSSPKEFNWVVSNGNINIDNTNMSNNRTFLCGAVFIYPKTQETFNKLFARWNIMVELGSTATPYVPYIGQTYPITFPSEAGTVYGAYVDVTGGELVVDRAIFTVDGSNDLAVVQFDTYTAVQLIDYQHVGGVHNVVFDACDRFVCSQPNEKGLYKVWNSNLGVRMWFGLPPEITTADEAKAWFAENPTQIVAKVVKESTQYHVYPLTPTEIKTILGQNNLWANTGDTEVEYRADVTMYINKKITEAVSALT